MEAYEHNASNMFQPQNDENNNNLDDLLQSQLCSACGIEKATVICTLCTSSIKPTLTDIIPAVRLIKEDTLASSVDNYYQNIFDDKDENDNLNSLNDINLDKLMKNGNYVYCLSCFDIVHSTMNLNRQNEHKPIDIFAKNSQNLNEHINLIVEDRIESLLDQVVNNSEKEIKLNESTEFINLDNFVNEITCLNQRCKQFNDVKLSIRQMNDLIRDDLHLDFGSLATLMQTKLDEISDKIKEKLKDAYSVVRDLQLRISDRINEIDQNIKEFEKMQLESEIKAQEMKEKEAEIMTQIQQINDDLKSICEPNYNWNSCTNSTFSCSLFIDNNLYPQLNYNVDLSKLIEAINELNVQIGPSLTGQKSQLQDPLLEPSIQFDASIYTGIATDGIFWVQYICENDQPLDPTKPIFKKNQQKLNLFLEEISRFVRSKRICDKDWQTYSEKKQVPKVGEKCFSLDPKSRRWLRSIILSTDESHKMCQVRFMDTGFTDTNQTISFDDLIQWKDFDIGKSPYRSLKCVLYIEDNDEKYIKDICTETRFLFKDLVTNQQLKCVLINQHNLDNDDPVWLVKIYLQSNTKNRNIMNLNKTIMDKNRQEKDLMNPNNIHKFSCTDIRLENGNLNRSIKTNGQSKSSPSSSMSSFSPACLNSTIVTETKAKLNAVSQKKQCSESFSVIDAQIKMPESSNEQIKSDELIEEAPSFDTNLEYSSNNNEYEHHEENLDIEDQIDERRFCKSRTGSCFVSTTISSNGIFWIRPIIPQNVFFEFKELSKFIGDFIRRTNYRSYGDLKIDPENNKKCFVRVYTKNNETEWFRGFIEKVFNEKETCRIRLMDKGKSIYTIYQDIYPHRRLDLNQIAKTHLLNEKYTDYDNHGLKLNYLAIRCCLFRDENGKLENFSKKFSDLVNPTQTQFRLIEQVTIGKIKCWLTELDNKNGNINRIIFNYLCNEQLLKQSKSVDLASLSQMNKLCETESTVSSTNTNREWLPVECRHISNSLVRSQSLYDIKETLDELNRNEETLKKQQEETKTEIKTEMANSSIKNESKNIKIINFKNDSNKKQNTKRNKYQRKYDSLPAECNNSKLSNIEFKSLQITPDSFSNETSWDAEYKFEKVHQPAKVNEEINTQESQEPNVNELQSKLIPVQEELIINNEQKQVENHQTHNRPIGHRCYQPNYHNQNQSNYQNNNNINNNQKKWNYKNKKQNNNCKQDGQYYKSNYKRDDGNDDDRNRYNNNKNYFSQNYDNQSNWNQNRYNNNNNGGGGGSNNNNNNKRKNYNSKNHQLNDVDDNRVQIGPPYLILDEDIEQNSSALNDVFIEEKSTKSDSNSIDDNSSLDQDHDLEIDFQLNHQTRVNCHLNSSPNSPYQKLFKLHPHNSYEQVLSRISENDSLRNVQKEPLCVYSHLQMDEIEKMRSIDVDHIESELNENETNNQEGDKLNVYDNSISSMPDLIIDNQTSSLEDDDHNQPGATLDQTHQIPNRHIINDIETNRSINREQTSSRLTANKLIKNRSFSAADVVLYERTNRPIQIKADTTDDSITTSSSTTTSLSDLKKQIDDLDHLERDDDDNESFASCPESNQTENSVQGTCAANTSCPKTSSGQQLCMSKYERMKKFTISIFVDDFEADTSNKTTSSNDSSTSSSASNSPNKMDNANRSKNVSNRDESFFTVSNSRNVVTFSNIHDAVDNMNRTGLRSSRIESDECKSLQDLEIIETRSVMKTCAYKRVTPQLIDEDAFIFTSNPNQFLNQTATAKPILASKPPLIPNHNLNNQLNQLSTIIELSQECSNSNETENDLRKSLKEKRLSSSSAGAADLSSLRQHNVEYWLNDFENNSNEFQKKIDFFNKLPTNDNSNMNQSIEIDSRNITFRKHKKLSANSSMPTQSLSNNCLSDLIMNNNNVFESILNEAEIKQDETKTDRLFEQFCQEMNDQIMDLTDDELDEKKSRDSKFIPNNADRYKINSKILNDLLEEPINMSEMFSNKLEQNEKKPSEKTTKSGVSSSSSEPVCLTSNESLNKIKSQTSLEISSLSSDSLFNSHLIITPFCSDIVSPNQNSSIVVRSPLNASTKQTTNSTLNSTSTPQSKFQLSNNDSIKTQSPLNQTLPSPPDFLTQKSVSLSSSSLPPPPPPLTQSVQQEEKTDSQINSSLPPAPPLPVFPLIRSVTKPQGKTNALIESLTAKLNLNSNEKKQPVQKNINNQSNLCKRDYSNSLSNLNQISSNNISSSTIKHQIPNSASSTISSINKSESNLKQSNSLNKHIDNYLNSVKIATGQELEQVKRKQVNEMIDAVKKSDQSNQDEWKSANFSLYGLDTDDDQDLSSNVKNRNLSTNPINSIKRRSNSECDSNDAKSIRKLYPNLNIFNNETEQNMCQSEPSSPFCFPPPPSQFLNSPKEQEQITASITSQTETNSFLPPPPQPSELAALVNNTEQTNSQAGHMISSSSSVTTVIPAENQLEQKQIPVSPRLSTFMKSIEKQDSIKKSALDKKTWSSLNQTSNLNQSPSSLPEPPDNKPNEQKLEHNHSCPNFQIQNLDRKKSFKLDHLLDINPKRLYRNSKFRCKIHDVIRENGKFWLEVIYSEEDERKFQEIFKLFNLCSRISEAPKKVYKQQRVSALYKGDWYRAIVLDEKKNSKVKVRFVDLGLEKILDQNTELREIDEKFFNCPLKALECSIYIDENINQLFINNQLRVNDKLKLSKEARKHFVKLVYKKVLFAKVIDFKEELNAETKEKKSICKIKLGCQAHHGIIDVYMYLLSKFDRERYELIKTLKNHITNQANNNNAINNNNNNNNEIRKNLVGVPIQTSIETTTITSTTTQTSNTVTSTAITCPSSIPSPPDSANNSIKHENDGKNFCSHEEDEENDEYYNDCIDKNDHLDPIDPIDVDVPTEQVDDEAENYYDEDDDDDVLFSDVVNYYYNKNILNDSSSGTYYSAGLNLPDPDDDDQEEGLDYTPVKDHEEDRLKYNYTIPLRIEPVILPDINNQDKVNNSTPKLNESNYSIKINEISTTKISTTNRMRGTIGQGMTPILIPQANPLKSIPIYKSNLITSKNSTNHSSDTDTSLQQAPCCIGLKRLSGSKNSLKNQSTYKVSNVSSFKQTVKEFGKSNDNLMINNKISSVNKKVKFSFNK